MIRATNVISNQMVRVNIGGSIVTLVNVVSLEFPRYKGTWKLTFVAYRFQIEKCKQ